MGIERAIIMATGIAVGLDKGHVVTKKAKKASPSSRKGRLANRVKLVREISRRSLGWLHTRRESPSFLGSERTSARSSTPSKSWELTSAERGRERRLLTFSESRESKSLTMATSPHLLRTRL